MNVYDFDKTIYRGDSTVDFWLWCLRRYPRAVRYVPGQVAAGLAWRMGLMGTREFKGRFFSFLAALGNAEDAACEFWASHVGLIGAWYLRQSSPDDIVVSASPRFLLEPVCDAMGVALIATEVDASTGALLSANCKGAEKVRRLREAVGDAGVDGFWSDSASDRPLADIAESAWLVRNGAARPWPKG